MNILYLMWRDLYWFWMHLMAFDMYEIAQRFWQLLQADDPRKLIASSLTSFVLIMIAEIGDKSQMVCIALAARHKPLPVLLGSVVAFALLNALAMSFGVAIASWFPDYIVAGTMTILFVTFGIRTLRVHEDDNNTFKEKRGRNVFFSAFLLMITAEFGDKTQLAVIALSSNTVPIAVWVGSTSALAFITALGIWLGRSTLQKIPMSFLNKAAGTLFLLLAVFAAYRAYTSFFD
jgi:putative Ca2+/H+ antiporter (TMEM165/GDT1 family)